MTLARALDSVAAALHHPIFDPLELERLRGIVEAASAVVDSVEDEREACANEIPTTWLDPLLTGESAALRGHGPWGCPDIERLLEGIRARIRARTATTPPADAGKETTT